MRFNHFLTTFLPSKEYGGERLFGEMVEQAVLADQLGYDAVAIPEHHLINLLIIPSPLQMAVKIAGVTKNVSLMLSIAVLPVRDMRVFAGEVVQADILCDGRIELGVGRGAFAAELSRLGVPLSETRERFDESLAVLEALLSREDVTWDGKYYKFEDATIMPRPARDMPIMIAAVIPEAIYHTARKGYDLQTTPLNADFDTLLSQVNAYKKGAQEANRPGQKLSLQRVTWLAKDKEEARRFAEHTYNYYKRFDNAFTGPGTLTSGEFEMLPRKQSIEEMMDNVLIGTSDEINAEMTRYSVAGIDELIMSSGFGMPQEDVLAMMRRFARDVMPNFRGQPAATGAMIAAQ